MHTLHPCCKLVVCGGQAYYRVARANFQDPNEEFGTYLDQLRRGSRVAWKIDADGLAILVRKLRHTARDFSSEFCETLPRVKRCPSGRLAPYI